MIVSENVIDGKVHQLAVHQQGDPALDIGHAHAVYGETPAVEVVVRRRGFEVEGGGAGSPNPVDPLEYAFHMQWF
ncbi:MAG: hypothetical protein ACTIJ2_02095 [Sphingobacteriaceae bacterium]